MSFIEPCQPYLCPALEHAKATLSALDSLIVNELTTVDSLDGRMKID